jgi:hypothetical protein
MHCYRTVKNARAMRIPFLAILKDNGSSSTQYLSMQESRRSHQAA